MTDLQRSIYLHLGIVVALALAFVVLPEYHQGNLARIMVLAIYAMGYNLLFGYTGLLSLGHALFFAAGMYGLGLTMQFFQFAPAAAFLMGLLLAAVVSLVVGFLALRTTGVSFMIVTLMFSQVGYLIILYFGEYTRGDEGFVIQQAQRVLAGIDLSQPAARYFAALLLFAACFFISAALVRSGFGLALVAIRENEERARMLGYNVTWIKLQAVVISGVMAGAGGAAYALLFGYAGATFASVQYSIFPLLWVLLGGAGVTVAPLIGTTFMFYLIDYSSAVTTAYMLIAGLVLVLLTLFVPLGIAGELRKRFAPWLP